VAVVGFLRLLELPDDIQNHLPVPDRLVQALVGYGAEGLIP
jgi:hypothetical protein